MAQLRSNLHACQVSRPPCVVPRGAGTCSSQLSLLAAHSLEALPASTRATVIVFWCIIDTDHQHETARVTSFQRFHATLEPPFLLSHLTLPLLPALPSTQGSARAQAGRWVGNASQASGLMGCLT